MPGSPNFADIVGGMLNQTFRNEEPRASVESIADQVATALMQWPEYNPEIWYNSDHNVLFVSPGDWEAPGSDTDTQYPDWDTVEQLLMGITGVDTVMVEPESAPGETDAPGEWFKLEWKKKGSFPDVDPTQSFKSEKPGSAPEGPHGASQWWPGDASGAGPKESLSESPDYTFFQIAVEDENGEVRAVGPEFGSLQDAVLAAEHADLPPGKALISRYATHESWPEQIEPGMRLGAPDFSGGMDLKKIGNVLVGRLGQDVVQKPGGAVIAVEDYDVFGNLEWQDPEWKAHIGESKEPQFDDIVEQGMGMQLSYGGGYSDLAEALTDFYMAEYFYSRIKNGGWIGQRDKQQVLDEYADMLREAGAAVAEDLESVYDHWIVMHDWSDPTVWSQARVRDFWEHFGDFNGTVAGLVDVGNRWMGNIWGGSGLDDFIETIDLRKYPTLRQVMERLYEDDESFWDEDEEGGEYPFGDVYEFWEHFIGMYTPEDLLEVLEGHMTASEEQRFTVEMWDNYTGEIFKDRFASQIPPVLERVQATAEKVAEVASNANQLSPEEVAMRVNLGLNEAHSSGPMMDYVEDEYGVSQSDLDYLSNQDVDEWDAKLRQMGVTEPGKEWQADARQRMVKNLMLGGPRESLAEGERSVNWDFERGVGVVTLQRSAIGYSAYNVQMKAVQFLLLNPSKGIGSIKSETYLKGAMRKGEPIGPPLLTVEWEDESRWRVISHEGRHRADAARWWAGDDVEIPVTIEPRQDSKPLRLDAMSEEQRAAMYTFWADNEARDPSYSVKAKPLNPTESMPSFADIAEKFVTSEKTPHGYAEVFMDPSGNELREMNAARGMGARAWVMPDGHVYAWDYETSVHLTIAKLLEQQGFEREIVNSGIAVYIKPEMAKRQARIELAPETYMSNKWDSTEQVFATVDANPWVQRMFPGGVIYNTLAGLSFSSTTEPSSDGDDWDLDDDPTIFDDYDESLDEANLTKEQWETWAEALGDSVEDLKSWYAKMDPTGDKHKYASWLRKRHSEDNFAGIPKEVLDNASAQALTYAHGPSGQEAHRKILDDYIRNLLAGFDKLKKQKKIKGKDAEIMNYDIPALIDLVGGEFVGDPVRQLEHYGGEVVHQDDRWIVVNIPEPEAAEVCGGVGHGAKEAPWCTRFKGNFNHYNHGAGLHFIYSPQGAKVRPKKKSHVPGLDYTAAIGVHSDGEIEFQDAINSPVDYDWVEANDAQSLIDVLKGVYGDEAIDSYFNNNEPTLDEHVAIEEAWSNWAGSDFQADLDGIVDMIDEGKLWYDKDPQLVQQARDVLEYLAHDADDSETLDFFEAALDAWNSYDIGSDAPWWDYELEYDPHEDRRVWRANINVSKVGGWIERAGPEFSLYTGDPNEFRRLQRAVQDQTMLMPMGNKIDNPYSVDGRMVDFRDPETGEWKRGSGAEPRQWTENEGLVLDIEDREYKWVPRDDIRTAWRTVGGQHLVYGPPAGVNAPFESLVQTMEKILCG